METQRIINEVIAREEARSRHYRKFTKRQITYLSHLVLATLNLSGKAPIVKVNICPVCRKFMVAEK